MEENWSLFDIKILEGYLVQRNSTGYCLWFDVTACLGFLSSGLKWITYTSVSCFVYVCVCACCQKIFHKGYNTPHKML